MSKTTYLGLEKPAESEFYRIQHFNDNADIIDKKVHELENKVGSPFIAHTAAQMTDKTRVYVYVGSESGYTKGNWYYHNGSKWISGGVYNSQGVDTDKNLDVEGKAADAKATGDRLSSITEDINEIGLIKLSNSITTNTALGTDNTNIYWINFENPLNACVSKHIYLTLKFEEEKFNESILIFVGILDGNNVKLAQIEKFTINAKCQTFKLNGGAKNIIIGFHGATNFDSKNQLAYATSGVVDYNNNVSIKNVGDTIKVKPVDNFYLSYDYKIKLDVNTESLGDVISAIKANTIIGVSGKGDKDYTSISDAVEYAKTISSRNNPITILIYPSIYNEKIVMQDNYISLIGVNKKDCIIINDSGEYDDSPILASGNFYIGNLTIKATHRGTPNFVENRKDDYTIGAYGLHIDNANYADSNDKIGIVENCLIYSEQNQAIGMGMAKNCKYIIRNCELVNNTPDRMYELYSRPIKTGAFGCHRGYFETNKYYQILEVYNCILRVNKGVAIQLGPFTKEGTGMEEHFYNNMLWSGTLGKNDNAIGTYLESPYTSYELSNDCYGNNVQALNK